VGEVFGMKVDLELVLKNLKDVQKKAREAFKNLPGGISEGAFGGAGGSAGALGKTLGKFAVISGALLIIGESIKRIGNVLASSSPMLKGVFDIFKRSMMIFFRPFGDALATFLKPAAIATMKMAVAWLKFWRSFKAEEGPSPAEVTAALPSKGRVIQGLPDEMAQELLNSLISGSQSFAELPQEMKEQFFGWLIENAEAIQQLPNDVRNNIIDWIGQNKAALQGLAPKINEAFGATLLDPKGLAILGNVTPNFANNLDNIFNKGTNHIRDVISNFISNFNSILQDKLSQLSREKEGGGWKVGVEGHGGWRLATEEDYRRGSIS